MMVSDEREQYNKSQGMEDTKEGVEELSYQKELNDLAKNREYIAQQFNEARNSVNYLTKELSKAEDKLLALEKIRYYLDKAHSEVRSIGEVKEQDTYSEEVPYTSAPTGLPPSRPRGPGFTGTAEVLSRFPSTGMAAHYTDGV